MNTSEKKGITTTTDEISTGVVFNLDYLRTTPGLLKLIQVVLGIVCIVIAAIHFNVNVWGSTEMLIYLSITITFMIGSSINLLSCLISVSNAPIMSKAVHEVIFHSVAFVLLLLAALAPVNVIQRGYSNVYCAILAGSIIGLINAMLYLTSAILARRTYKEMSMMDAGIMATHEKSFLSNHF